VKAALGPLVHDAANPSVSPSFHLSIKHITVASSKNRSRISILKYTMEEQWTEAQYEVALAKLEALTDKVSHPNSRPPQTTLTTQPS
jgi:hypothetical protein